MNLPSREKTGAVLLCINAIIGGIIHYISPEYGLDFNQAMALFSAGYAWYGNRAYREKSNGKIR